MLTERDRAVLDVESRHWRYAATKEQHVRETLGLTPVRYYQVVAALVDHPDAAREYPRLVTRLRAVRAQGRRRAA